MAAVGEMGAGVLVGRGVATPHITAAQAKAELGPALPQGQAVGAPGRRLRLHLGDLILMGAGWHD